MISKELYDLVTKVDKKAAKNVWDVILAFVN